MKIYLIGMGMKRINMVGGDMEHTLEYSMCIYIYIYWLVYISWLGYKWGWQMIDILWKIEN